MMHRAALLALLVVGGPGCGGSDPPDKPMCEGIAIGDLAAAPPGTQPGEPYRWLGRSWQSPLGLTIRSYGLAVDGVPVYGRHQVEIYGPDGRLAYRAGTGDAVLAALHARGASGWAAWRHPLASLSGARPERSNPLAHTTERPVWHYAHGDLAPAVVADRLDLLGDTPVGEQIVRDAVTGAVLARRRTIHDLTDPEYLVYARDDGRPLGSPLGDSFPHPTGVPDGRVPPTVPQQLRRQSQVTGALSDPWLPPTATQTTGNNVVAFFDSLLDRTGKLADLFDDMGNGTPEYGPEPDDLGHDFFATASGNRFAFRYDPARTASEYFQSQPVGTAVPPPAPADLALNAKIVQAFYATNWLHDYFYRAGFDEVAGNAQQVNFGRGGVSCDPLIVHAGFNNTFTFPATEGISPVLDLGLNTRSASKRDAAMDFSVLSHEWGHYLIGRLAGGTVDHDALGNLQGQSLHEGIADFVGILVNLDAGDDPRGAFAVGSYDNLDYLENRPTLPPGEARADAMYYGIRRYPYSLDLHKNPLTFRHLAEPPPADLPYYNWKGRGPQLSELHTAGEVFSQGLFQCLGNLIVAHPGPDFEAIRARMAQYLVAGLAAFPDHPSMLDARNAFLGVVRLASPTDDYPACRAGFAARGMGADTLGPDREFGSDDPTGVPVYDPAQIEESFLDKDRALRLISSAVTATGGAGGFTLRVDLRNTGLVELTASSLEIAPEVPAAVVFPNGPRVDLAALPTEQVATASVAVTVDACMLPVHPTQPGFRAFDYTVTATSAGPDPVSRVAMYHAAVPTLVTCQ